MMEKELYCDKSKGQTAYQKLIVLLFVEIPIIENLYTLLGSLPYELRLFHCLY